MGNLSTTGGFLRETLLDRRERLASAIAASPEAAHLDRLLGEIDSALERMKAGTYGLCETCHESIEKHRLMTDPLCCYCLDHLTPAEKTALEQDLELASRMQREMLPKQDWSCCGWEISYHYRGLGPVSGDYCDVLSREGDGEAIFFALGDASGKGVAASMLTSHLHAILRTLAFSELPAHELVSKANRIFSESAMAPYFATLVCGKAWASGEVEICNAGHCPPIVLQEGQSTYFEATGTPLGLFGHGDYRSQAIKFQPGDTLFIYTDGLSEARNGSNEEYGEARLNEMIARRRGLAPKALVEACLEDLESFLDGAGLADDLSLMAIRRTRA